MPAEGDLAVAEGMLLCGFVVAGDDAAFDAALVAGAWPSAQWLERYGSTWIRGYRASAVLRRMVRFNEL